MDRMAFLEAAGPVRRRKSLRGGDSRLGIHLGAEERRILSSKSFSLLVSEMYTEKRMVGCYTHEKLFLGKALVQ